MAAQGDHGPEGETFESFLDELGIKDEVYLTAQKQVISWQLQEAMRANNLSKSALAARLRTSRTQVDRVLDPENVAVSLETLHRAAAAVGKRIRVVIEDADTAA